MSLAIHVEKENDRLTCFYVDEDVIEIEATEDRWPDPNGEFFKVRSAEGKTYLLCYNNHEDEWTLRSGFDGDELLARPSIEVIVIDSKTIRQALSQVTGCGLCLCDGGHIPLDWLFAEITGKHGPYEFAMTEAAFCPKCSAILNEKSLIDVEGGVEVESQAQTK